MSDLDKLIESVEGGSCPSIIVLGASLPFVNVMGAFNGSLDAARALHEALLPGCKWSMQGDTGHASVWGEDSDGAHTDPSNPARSWLIAVLKAYRSLP